MTPYYEDTASGITIYHGDCREVLPTLQPAGLVLTDTPLGSGRYGRRGTSVSLWLADGVIHVQWREIAGTHAGKRRHRTWPNTRENRAYAKTWAEEFAAARAMPLVDVEPLTLRDLWTQDDRLRDQFARLDGEGEGA